MAARVSSPVFVGRNRELDVARAATTTAAEGTPTILLVGGEAGVGKTRFVAEVTSHLPTGSRILTGGCVDVAAGTVPYAPLTEALRELARSTPAAELDRVLGPGRGDLANLLPQLRRRGDESTGTSPSSVSGQARLFEAVLGLFDRLTAGGPVVLVIEDIHWADRSTLDMLAFLARNLHRLPVLLIVTFRSDELRRGHPIAPLLAELKRRPDSVRIDLRRFDRDEVADQLSAIAGKRPSPGLVDRIYAQSEGNAFFAEELLASDGSSSGAVSDTLREVLDARLATLSEPTQGVLRVAAAAGTNVRADLLASAAGLDDAHLVAALREAIDRQVLVAERHGSSDRYRFRHALMREAIYDELLPPERTQLHTRFADALGALSGSDPSASDAAQIAYHRFDAGDFERALDASVRAGTAAETASAFAEAQVQFERALELWPKAPDAERRAGMDRVDLLARAASAASKGAYDRAVELITEAIGLVDLRTDPERAGLLRSRLSHYRWLSGDGQGALIAGREAVRLVPSRPTLARAQVTAGLGQILMVEGFMEDSVPLSEEAVSVAREVGARQVEGHALNSLGTDIGYLGDFEGGLAKLGEARHIAEEVGSVDDVARAHANIVDLHNVVGRYAETARLATIAFDYDEPHGMARYIGTNAICEGALALYRLGRWVEADALLDRLDRYELSGNAALFVSQRRAALEIGRGQFAGARARLDSAAAAIDIAVDPQWTAPHAELTAELALWQELPGEADGAIEDGVARFERVSVIVAGQVGRLGPVYALGVRAAADLAALARTRHDEASAVEQRSRSRGHLERMRAMHAEISRELEPMRPLADGYLALCEAEATRLDGRSDPTVWAVAADKWGRQDLRPAQAYALWRQAEALLGASRARVEAGAVLREAHALAAGMGAEPLLVRVKALAARARIPLEPAKQRGGNGAGPAERFGLTTREHEVLGLLVLGRTNRQIADALFITEKTAGAHVSNILNKLDAHGRTEAAAIARRYDLVPDTTQA